MNKNWDKVIDGIQNLMIFILIIAVAACILALIGFDGVVGAGSMMYLTNQNLKASVGISMATTGLLMSLMFIGYNMVVGSKSKLFKTTGVFILVVSGVVYGLDVYFDSMTADYLRFGEFVALNTLIPHARNIQILFRSLIGGLSTVGEALAVAIILGMPVLKNIISDSLSENEKPQNTKGGSSNKPTHSQHNRPSFTLNKSTFDKLPKKFN